MIYMIPKQLKEENKIWDRPKVFWKDIKTCVVLFGLFLLFKNFVHAWFMIPYWVSALLFSAYLIQPAASNPKKRNWEALILFLFKDHTVYRSINHIQEEDSYADKK